MEHIAEEYSLMRAVALEKGSSLPITVRSPCAAPAALSAPRPPPRSASAALVVLPSLCLRRRSDSAAVLPPPSLCVRRRAAAAAALPPQPRPCALRRVGSAHPRREARS